MKTPRQYGLPDWFFFSMLILLTVLFFNMISWIIVDIIMAAVLAHLCNKLFKWLTKKGRVKPSISAFVCVLVTLVGIVIPLLLLGLLIYRELFHLVIWFKANWTLVQSWFTLSYWDAIYGDKVWWRNIIGLLDQVQMGEQLGKGLGTLSRSLLHIMNRIVVDFGMTIFHVVIVMILQFFILKDQLALIGYIQKLSPLRLDDEKELFDETARIVNATIFGTIILGLIEGALGGVLFLLFGLPSPVLWSVVMMLFSIIPFIGIQSVIIPAVIILCINGVWIKALLLLGLALLCSLFTQQYLRPYLIGTRGGMNPGVVLVCMLGGLAGFGVLGFIMGPIIGSLLISLWNQFGRHYSAEIDLWGRGKT